MSTGSEFQTFGVATLKARLAVSVVFLGTNSLQKKPEASSFQIQIGLG